MSAVEVNLADSRQIDILEAYARGVGMTPRMITNVETGENYRDGQHAADILGVTRQAVCNCVNGRQGTVGGYHLVSAPSFRRELMKGFVDICHENGTDPMEVVEEFRRL